jgi:hypothetical protein
MGEPKLLRVPSSFRNVGEVLACAEKMNLPNVVLLSEGDDGTITFLTSDMSLSQANWILDRVKLLLLRPDTFERKGP